MAEQPSEGVAIPPPEQAPSAEAAADNEDKGKKKRGSFLGGRFKTLGSLLSSVGASAAQAASATMATMKMAGSQAMEQGKVSLASARDELRNKTTALKTYSTSSLSQLTSQTREATAAVTSKAKTVKKKAITVGSKVRAATRRKPSSIPMDCDAEAGVEALQAYQAQWAIIHALNKTNAALSVRGAHTVNRANAFVKQQHASVSALHSQLSALPDVMETLAASVDLLSSLKQSLEQAERALDDYELAVDDAHFHRIQAAEEMRVQQHRMACEASYHTTTTRLQKEQVKRIQQLEKEAQGQLAERRQVYEALFREQMEYFRKHQTTDAIRGRVELAPDEVVFEDIPDVDPVGHEQLSEFLADVSPSKDGDRAADDDDEDEAPPIEILTGFEDVDDEQEATA